MSNKRVQTIRAVNYRSGSVQGGDACVALDSDSISGQRRKRKYQRPTEGSDAPSSTLTWPAMSGSATSKQARDGMVNLRPLSAHRRGRLGTRGGAQHHRLDDESKDLPVMCVEDNAQLTLKHLTLTLQQSECRRRGRRCRYARRLASPHSPGRHLDCHTVGDRRSS